MSVAPMGNRRTRTKHRRDIATDAVDVGRSLDAESARRFVREVTKLLASGARSCIIDLSLTESVDSPGFGSLMSAIRKVRDLGGVSAIVCNNAAVRRLFEIAGITRLVPVVARLEDARAAVAAETADAIAS